MRKENINIYERQLMHTIGGLLFDMAPNRQPRKVEIIMTKARDKFRQDAYNDNEWYFLSIEKDKLNSYIKELLFSIPEFEELNLTQIEYENNVNVNDENRSKYKFVSSHDNETKESWKTDFIDLDAFVRNVYSSIYNSIESDKECFFCTHSSKENSEECNSCSLNPKFTVNYKSSREPKGKYNFSCKYNCYRSFQICCEECKEKDVCEKKCESNSETCGLSLYKN